MRQPTPSSLDKSRLIQNRQGGFTLIEVMIAAAIGATILFATMVMFDTANKSRIRLVQSNDTSQAGKFALDILEGELQLAGFYGQGVVATTLPGSMPDPCSTTAADWLAALRMPVQGLSFNASNLPSCLPTGTSLVTNSQVVVIRRAATCIIDTTNCAAGSSGAPMIQLSQCQTAAQEAVTGTNTASLTLTALDCTTTATIRPYVTRIYYLDQNNASGDGIPTLKRLELGSSGFTRVTVALGVEQFRLVYGIDSSNDGVADSWSSAPTAIADLTNIVEVKAYLLSRSANQETGYSNNRSYVLGDLTVNASNDQYYRRLQTKHIRVINVAQARAAV